MTITLAWIRRITDTPELVVASDSRLRSRGALDQSQKLFPLQREDCCLGFSGDAQIAYPLFVQVGTAINNYIKTRSRAVDVTSMSFNVMQILNNLIDSWDLSRLEEDEELSQTKVLLAGWSWKYQRFEIGYFQYKNGSFAFHHRQSGIPHPWKERVKSLVFIGDYRLQFNKCLAAILEKRHGKQTTKNR